MTRVWYWRRCWLPVAWAGLRPLRDASPQPVEALSRGYTFEWGPKGLFSILGGKLTLHGEMATDALRRLFPALGGAGNGCRPSSDTPLLPGAQWRTDPARIVDTLWETGVEEESVAYLLRTYGARSERFVDLLREDSSRREPLTSGLPPLWAEVPFAIRNEMAIRPEDFLFLLDAFRAGVHGVAPAKSG